VYGRELALLLVRVTRFELAGTANSLPTCIHTVGPMSIPMKRSRRGWICLLLGDLDEEGGAELAGAGRRAL
jgi:hypothetical protein